MKVNLKESFKVQHRIQASFTHGYLRIDDSGDHILSSTGDTIKILTVADGSEVASIREKISEDVEDEVIDFVTGHHDGVDKVFAAYRSGLLKEWTWNDEGANLKRTWKSLHAGPMSTLAIADKGRGDLVASGASDTIVKVWDVIKQYCTHHLKGCRGVVSTIQFYTNPLGVQMIGASGDLDNVVNIWKLEDSELVACLSGHCSRVVSLQFFTQDEKDIVISASRDMLAIVWSFMEGVALRKIPLFEAVESMILLGDNVEMGFLGERKKGKIFMTGGSKGVVKAWDTTTGSCVFTQSNSITEKSDESSDETQPNELIIQCLLHPDLSKLIVVTFERNILFYDLTNFNLIRQSIGFIDQVTDIKFIGTEEKHIVVATNSPNMLLFHLETMESFIIKGHSSNVLSVQVYPMDKTIFASSSKDNDVRLWEFDETSMTAKCLYIASGHSMSAISLGVPNKSMKWLFSGSEDTTMKVWKLPNKLRHENETEAHLSTLETVKAHDGDINAIAVSPNDQLLASCSQDKTAKIWSFDKNLTLTGTLKGHRRGIWSISFSPVDLVVATGSADTTIKIWSLNDFSCLKTLQSHESSVLNFTFVNKGMQIISSSSDGNIKLWTVKTGDCTATLDGHTARIWALTINSDEQLMASGAEDSQIIVWKDDTVEKIEETIKKQEQFIEHEQKLMNYIQQQNWTKALALAIKLDQPFRALNIVKEILFTPDQDKLQILESALKGLREDQLVSLVKYSINWNTNSKNSEAAQSILRVLLNLLGPEGILNLSESKEIVEGFLSYTKRHMNRINKLAEQVTVIDFLYSNIKLD